MRSIPSVPSLKSLLLCSAVLGGCASSVTALEREGAFDTSRRGSIQLDLVAHADATRTFPSVIEARLPTADRLASQIRFELGDRAAVDVRLCVAAAGTVDSITVLRSSTLPAFDDDATITYQPRS
jgi:hypothetical protein